MSDIGHKLKHEIIAVALTTLYFAVCFGLLIVLKTLVLEEYHVAFWNLSFALLGALIVAKVVLIFEHVPLGKWLEHQPAIMDVVVRSTIYALAALVLLVLEKAFEARHEAGGFGASLQTILHHRDMPHVWANTLCVAVALAGFNALAIIRRHLGELGGGRSLTKLFLKPPPGEKASPHHPGSSR